MGKRAVLIYMENNLLQKPLLDLYQDLHRLTLDENAVTVAPDALAYAMERLGPEERRPLLVSCPPTVNPALFLNVTRQVAAVINKHFPFPEAVFDGIILSLQEKPEQLAGVIAQMFVPGTDLSTCFRQEFPPEALGLLFSHTVQLFMKPYVKAVAPALDLDRWRQGVCPVCGGKPSLALLEKENQGRFLYCGYCELKWRFPRLGCPFCPSRESQYLFIEEMGQYRGYVCDQCGGYLKTVVCAQAGDEALNLMLEDLNSIQMDLFALKEGYHK